MPEDREKDEVRSRDGKWLIWQRMTRVLGAMAQVGLAQIGQSPPPKAELHQPLPPFRRRSCG